MTPKERQRQVLAWMVLWACFATFLAVAGGAILGIRWYMGSATESQPGWLTIVKGTVLVRPPGQPVWVEAAPEMSLDRGTAIKTDDTSEALVTLFDQSTVALYPRAEIALLTMDQSRFAPLRHSLTLAQSRGQTRITLSSSLGEGRHFEVRAPQGTVLLERGSFSINVQGVLEVRTRQESRGWVSANGGSIALDSGQKTRVDGSRPPAPPQPAQEELVANGRFREGMRGWVAGHEAGYAPDQDVPGQVRLAQEGYDVTARFWRQGSHNTHSETYLVQSVDRDVADFSALQLRVSFKLLLQSLSGGGYMGSEYPLTVRVDYETARGPNFVIWGFYFQNRDQNRTDIGTLVPPGEWVDYTVAQNLMELSPHPRRILSIKVSASGWDYESLVREVGLVGE